MMLKVENRDIALGTRRNAKRGRGRGRDGVRWEWEGCLWAGRDEERILK